MVPETEKTIRLPDYANPPVVETILGVQFERLDLGRQTIVGSFAQLTTEAANQYWGRSDGDD